LQQGINDQRVHPLQLRLIDLLVDRDLIGFELLEEKTDSFLNGLADLFICYGLFYGRNGCNR